MSKCGQCPIAGPCFGEKHAWACERADWGESSRKMLAELGAEPTPAEPAPKTEYPPLVRQAANAVASAVRFISSGCKTVDQAEYDRRQAICQACPTKQYDAEQDRCRACGCLVAIKPWGKAESCPDGHW